MPLYEYQCESCAERFERIQKYSDPPVAICPSCNGPVRKLLSSPAIQFKGTGWYITDYAKKSSSGDSKSGEGSKDSSSSSSTEGGGSTASTKESTDSKPASKDSGSGTKSTGTTKKD